MPSLNTNERRLVIVMGVALFLAANFFGWMMISEATASIAIQEKKQKADLGKLEEAKTKATEAEKARTWIDGNIRTYESELQRETYLNDEVIPRLISGLDLEQSKNLPMTTLTGDFFIKSRYRTTVKGPWNDVMEFIYRLQSPKDMRFVPRITLLPKKNELDDSQQLVEASLELEQWWAKPDGIAMEEEPVEVEQPAAETVNPSTPETEKPAVPAAPAPATPVPVPAPVPLPSTPAAPPP